MKRLLEMSDRDPGDERLAELFAAIPKTDSDPFRKQRVRTKLMARRFGASRWSSNLRRAIISGSLLVGTAAAAMVGQRIRAHWASPQAEAPRPAQAPTALPRAVSSIQSTGSVTSPNNEVHDPPEASSIPVEHETATRASANATEDATPSVAVDHKVLTRGTSNASEDPTLVAAAIKALRNQHDPAKARTLLNEYLRTHPRGALVEEALALSIEAAAALKDPDAARLGCRYLSIYPHGRHRALAARVCGKSSAGP